MRIIVQPKYPLHPSPSVVEDFKRALADEFPEHDVITHYEEPVAPQVSLWQTIIVWLCSEEGKVASSASLGGRRPKPQKRINLRARWEGP